LRRELLTDKILIPVSLLAGIFLLSL